MNFYICNLGCKVNTYESNIMSETLKRKGYKETTEEEADIVIINTCCVTDVALKKSLNLLKLNGRICVITFHSLEDKICKDIFNEVSKNPEGYKDMPVVPENLKPKFKKIKTIEPSKEELIYNNRARSAKLRIIEKVGE